MDQALLVYLLTLIFTLDHMWIFRMCFITVDLCLMFHSVLKLFSSFHLLWFQLLRNQKQNHKLGINLPVPLRLNHRHLKVINIVVALKCQGDNCVSVQYEKKQKQKWEPIHTFLFAGQSVLGQMVSGNLPLWLWFDCGLYWTRYFGSYNCQVPKALFMSHINLKHSFVEIYEDH